MHKARYCLLAAVLLVSAPAAMAQLQVGGSALDNCAQIDALRRAGNLTEARDKAQICLEALEQEVTGSVGKLFAADVAGWKQTKIEQENALGFTNVTATYVKAETTATVSLTGTGAGDTGLGGLLGGFETLKLTPHGDLKVTRRGNIAWTTVTFHLSAKQKSGGQMEADGRHTAIWEKRAGKWLIVHEHFSTPLTG